jgi:hypothetical protein
MQDRRTVEYFARYALEYGTERFRYASEFIKSHASAESALVEVGCGLGDILEYIRRETRLRAFVTT